MTTLKDILQNIRTEADKALADLEKPEQAVDPHRFVPEYSEDYFYITDTGEIEQDANSNYSEDKYRILTGNCYRTKEQAEKALEIINRIGELRGDWLPDWGDELQRKHCPFKNHEGNYWKAGYACWREEGCIYMPTEQAAQTLIDEYGDDLLLVMRRL